MVSPSGLQPGALHGLKIVELADGIPGPYCGKLLADLGAEVIKVERPGEGDLMRSQPPFFRDEPSPNSGLIFNFVNTSKLGVTLDVDVPQGRNILNRLLDDADVLLVAGTARDIKEQGMEFKTISQTRDKLVCIYVTPFGLEGPHRDWKGGELVAFHMSAMGIGTPRHRFGARTERPLKFGGNQALMIAGLSAATATMHALFARDALGNGQCVDISEAEPMASFQFLNMARWVYTGDDGSHGFGEGARRFWASDGAVSMLLFTGQLQQWEAFKDMLDRPAWLEAPEYQPTAEHRVPMRDDFWARVNEWSGQYTREEIYRKAQGLRVPLFPENTVPEAIDSAQIEARGFVQEMPLANGATIRAPMAPYVFSETPARFFGAAPSLGRDNESIFCGRLGLTQQELKDGTQAGLF